MSERVIRDMYIHIHNGGMNVMLCDYGYGPTLRLTYGHFGKFEVRQDFHLSPETLKNLGLVYIRGAAEDPVLMSKYENETPEGSWQEKESSTPTYLELVSGDRELRFGYDHDHYFGLSIEGETHSGEVNWFMECTQTTLLRLGMMFLEESNREYSPPEEAFHVKEPLNMISPLNRYLGDAIQNVAAEQRARDTTPEERRTLFEEMGFAVESKEEGVRVYGPTFMGY